MICHTAARRSTISIIVSEREKTPRQVMLSHIESMWRWATVRFAAGESGWPKGPRRPITAMVSRRTRPSRRRKAKITCFAYGSNMLSARMRSPERVPSARPMGVGYITGHRMTFNKVSWKDGSGKCDAEQTTILTTYRRPWGKRKRSSSKNSDSSWQQSSMKWAASLPDERRT